LYAESTMLDDQSTVDAEWICSTTLKEFASDPK
jgi:hypothetical protein